MKTIRVCSHVWLHFHLHSRDHRGVITQRPLAPLGEGRVSEGHELLAPRPPRGMSHSEGCLRGHTIVPSPGPRSFNVTHAVPPATWTASSRPSQKETPCLSRTLAKLWTPFWTLSWAGTRLKREGELPCPSLPSNPREPLGGEVWPRAGRECQELPLLSWWAAGASTKCCQV